MSQFEVLEAAIIQWARDCRDDIGDIVVTLILQCFMQGTCLAECLSLAYDEIRQRQGRMVNGAFVKDGDSP